jgi:hypothetical protein
LPLPGTILGRFVPVKLIVGWADALELTGNKLNAEGFGSLKRQHLARYMPNNVSGAPRHHQK